MKAIKWFIIRHMKEIWIAVMAVSYGGLLGFLMRGISLYDSRGYDPLTITVLALAPASVALGVFAFTRATRIGRAEDAARLARERKLALRDMGTDADIFDEITKRSY